MAPYATSSPASTERIVVGSCAACRSNWASRSAMSTATIAVTVTMTAMCQFAVRHTCV